jgi:hypothetical protein
MKGNPKVYTRKRPAHPDEAHTRNKRWFKKKSRKSARKFYKNEEIITSDDFDLKA